MSKTKKRIETIREKLKELRHKLSRSELKEIRKHLYNIENKSELLELETTKEYLDELDEKILESDDNDFGFIGIENVHDLFKILIYKPTIVKSGYNNNYIEYRSEADKLLTTEEYLALIELYLRELINDHKSKGEWKTQLTAQINFISSRWGSDETRAMHPRSVNEELTNGSDTDEIIKELFKSLLQRYQENLQEIMRGSDFVFDGVNFLYYDFNKISISRGGSYIDSPKWIKDKKSTINPKNSDYKCFQYAVTLALNLDKINKNSQRISKIKPFIEEYNWKDIDFPSTSKDWKKFELNNEIALNILYVPRNTKKIAIAYQSKHNLTREKQVILLMISNGENWHYLVVKSLSGLLTGITFNHKENFYCLNCFHSYRTKNKLEAHKKICENRVYCRVEMSTKDNNAIKYNHGEKSIKLLFVVYADLECLLEKMSTCYNNPEESSTTKINKHTPSSYSIFTHCSFDKSKNKLNYYRGEDCMTKFCKDLRGHETKIINYEKKDMIPLTKKVEENYNNQKVCYICKKEFDKSDKKHRKVRDHCHYSGKYRGAAHNICNLRYKIPKETPIVFHNGSTYDYHFIIKELVKEFDGNFKCLGENTEKYITFSVPMKKKIENKDIEITYKIKFIDSFRFMATSLSNLVDNLTEDIHGDKCVDCKSDLSYMRVIDEALIFRCFNCKKNYEKEINKELIERFASTYKFCNNDLNKFVMLLRKGVYPYEYMDGWDKFNETSIPSKESFYSNLTMENISETDYRHANNVFKTFKLNNLGDYHDLYVQSDTLLLADVFENFRKACIKTYELDPAHFISLPGLVWLACLKKAGVELELLTDYDMLLMIEKGIRGGICHAVHRYAKANNEYMKNYDKSKESSYIQYLDTNNLYGAAMSEKLPKNGFKWVNDISGINEKFVKSYDKKIVTEVIYLKWMLIIQLNYINYIVTCHFYLKK